MTQEELLSFANGLAASLLACGFADAMTILVFTTIETLNQGECLDQAGADLFHSQLTRAINLLENPQ